MTTFYSDQVTNQIAVPVAPIKTNELEGRVRIAYFSYSSPATGMPVATELIHLCKLPIGARVLRGHVAHDGIGGASGTVDIGYSGAQTRYGDDIALANTAGAFDFADTYAQNVGDALTAAQTILMLVNTATMTASKNLRGWILYVVD